MKPNPYESTRTGNTPTQRRGILRWLAVAVSFMVCTAPTGIAVYAWLTHWHWQRTGAYSRNSFPMNKFASDATWVAVASIAIVGCGWGMWAVMNRKRFS